MFFFSRRNLTGSVKYRRSSLIPQITDIQADALDALHFAALKHSIRHAPERGEIHLVHNLAIMHAREDFIDADVANGRHLMRLWLKIEKDIESLPTHIKNLFQDMYKPESLAQGKWELSGFNSILATTDEGMGSSS